jgi:hypothetical protein
MLWLFERDDEQATHMTTIERLWTFALDYSRARRSREWNMAER